MSEFKSVTDIDDVIKYAEQESEGYYQMVSAYHTDEGVYIQEETRFRYKAELWNQISEWLEELKELRKKQKPHGQWEYFKELITETRDADGKLNQKQTCQFILNLMGVIERGKDHANN